MDIGSLMDRLGELIQEFDPANFMPELGSMLGIVELVCRIAVLLTPVALLALGLMYFLVPPREANHSFGYRFYWGMSSVESWLFTQKLAGLLWSIIGLVLTIVMALICNSYRGMEVMEIVWSAAECILWELALVAGSIILIDLTVVICFNRKGVLRWVALKQWREERKKRAERKARAAQAKPTEEKKDPESKPAAPRRRKK